VPLRRGSFALLCLLGSASSALAQGPDDFLRTFGAITQPAIVQATQAAWAELTSEEAGCINDALYQQGGSVEALIQRGVLPSDPRLAKEASRNLANAPVDLPSANFIKSSAVLNPLIKN
jgi:hypothetical protein